MMTTSPPLQKVLGDILRTAKDIKSLCNPSISQTLNISPSESSTPLAPIKLPDPPPVYAQIIELGLEHRLAEQYSRVYLAKAAELRRQSERTILAACSSIVQLPRSSDLMHPTDLQRKLHVVHEAIYMKTLQRWIEETLAAASKLRTSVHQVPMKPQGRQPFNYVSAPHLCSISC